MSPFLRSSYRLGVIASQLVPMPAATTTLPRPDAYAKENSISMASCKSHLLKEQRLCADESTHLSLKTCEALMIAPCQTSTAAIRAICSLRNMHWIKEVRTHNICAEGVHV